VDRQNFSIKKNQKKINKSRLNKTTGFSFLNFEKEIPSGDYLPSVVVPSH
jgi:hypothetical protein